MEQQQEPKQPVYKKLWFWLLIGAGALIAFFGLLVFLAVILTLTTDDETPTAEPTVTTTAPPVTEEPADPEPEESATEESTDEPDPVETAEPVEAPPTNAEADSQFTINNEHRRTRVEFEIENAFTKNGIKRNAERQTLEAIQAATERFPDYDTINVIGEFITTDQYGNEGMSSLIDLYFEKDTVEKINFDNAHNIKIFEIHDGGKLHPDLRG